MTLYHVDLAVSKSQQIFFQIACSHALDVGSHLGYNPIHIVTYHPGQ